MTRAREPLLCLKFEQHKDKHGSVILLVAPSFLDKPKNHMGLLGIIPACVIQSLFAERVTVEIRWLVRY